MVYSKTLPFMIALDALGDTAEESLKRGTDKGTALLNGAVSGGMNYLASQIGNKSNTKSKKGLKKLKEIPKKVSKEVTKNYVGNFTSNVADSIITDDNSLYYNKLLDNYYDTDMNSFEAQHYAKLYAYFNKPLSKATYVEPHEKPRKNAWDMSSEEFDNYINGILDN